ncbi:hypothetical protein AAE478_006244 [Parahypoxylon ruwenzoriense]
MPSTPMLLSERGICRPYHSNPVIDQASRSLEPSNRPKLAQQLVRRRAAPQPSLPRLSCHTLARFFQNMPQKAGKVRVYLIERHLRNGVTSHCNVARIHKSNEN